MADEQDRLIDIIRGTAPRAADTTEQPPVDPNNPFDDLALAGIRQKPPELPDTYDTIPRITRPPERTPFDLTADGVVNEDDRLASAELHGRDATAAIVNHLDSDKDGVLSANEINQDRISQLSAEQLQVLGSLLNGAGVVTSTYDTANVTSSLSLFNQVVAPAQSTQNER